MKIITRQMLADQAAQKWYQQYANSSWWLSSNKRATHEALLALGEHPKPEDVDRVIGNGSWTNLSCHECGNGRVDCVVEVGEPPDYESRTAQLCLDCIDKITALAAEARGK